MPVQAGISNAARPASPRHAGKTPAKALAQQPHWGVQGESFPLAAGGIKLVLKKFFKYSRLLK